MGKRIPGNNNGDKLTISHKLTKILIVSRKSHYLIVTLSQLKPERHWFESRRIPNLFWRLFCYIYSDAIRKGKYSVFHLDVMIDGDIWLFEFIAM